MSITGKDFLEYARHINSEAISFPADTRNLSQAAYRTIINRSYYGAFIYAREFLNITDTGITAHGSVGTALKNKNRQIGNNLSDLLKHRKDADYKTHLTFSARTSKEAIRLAGKILKYIDDETST